MASGEGQRVSIELSPDQAKKVREAINVLSSLPTSLGAGPSSTATSTPPVILGNKDTVREATDSTLAALNKLREGNRRKKVKEEMGGLLCPKSVKKLKICSWKHKFCCLAYRNQNRMPTTVSEKEMLLRAGLGYKEIEFEDLYIKQEEFEAVILENFPRLKGIGGYRFLKGGAGGPGNRGLELLSLSVHSSPFRLKERVGTSRTYVRPVQQDLDTSPVSVEDEEAVPMENCLTCGERMNLDALEEHLRAGCNKRSNTPRIEVDLTGDATGSELELPTFMEYLSGGGGEQGHQEQERVDHVSETLAPDDNPLVQQAISQSLSTSVPKMIDTLGEAIKAVCGPCPDKGCHIKVRRNHLLKDAIKEARKSKFDTKRLLKICWRMGSRSRGPRREFFRKLGIEAQARFLAGKFFMYDMSSFQKRDYYNLGRYAAMSIGQGGSGFPFLHDSVFVYMTTGNTTDHGFDVALEDIPDGGLQFVCAQLQDAKSDEDIQGIFALEKAQALLLETGYSRPLSQLKLSHKDDLKITLVGYHCMVKVKAAIDQFIEGLGNTFKLVTEYPQLAKPLFVSENKKLTAAEMKAVQEVKFSEVGTARRPAEEQAWVYFGDFLDHCEEGSNQCSHCTLEDVLIFCSGASSEPPLGFPVKPKVVLLYGDAKLCTSSTCDIELRLPTVHANYDVLHGTLILGT